MGKYRFGHTNEAVIRCSDGVEIPLDPNNPDWVEFKEWRDAGGEPDPYDGPQMFGRQPIIPVKRDG
jgi:hypothetical protein